MTEVFETIRNWPLAFGWIALFVIVVLRAGATYGLGRAIAAGALKRHSPSARTSAAIERVHRWGPWAVAASFFTIGIQSVVNFAAGLIRMPFQRYLLGLIPGAMIWATLWLTVGLGAVIAFLSADGLDRAVGIAVLILVVLGLRWWRRGWLRRDASDSDESAFPSEGPHDPLS